MGTQCSGERGKEKTLSQDCVTQKGGQKNKSAVVTYPSPDPELMAAGETVCLGGGCSGQLATVVRMRGSVPFIFSCSVKPTPSLSQGRWARPETNHTEAAGLSSRGLRAFLHWADFTQDWVSVLLKLLQAGLGISCTFFTFILFYLQLRRNHSEFQAWYIIQIGIMLRSSS